MFEKIDSNVGDSNLLKTWVWNKKKKKKLVEKIIVWLASKILSYYQKLELFWSLFYLISGCWNCEDVLRKKTPAQILFLNF